MSGIEHLRKGWCPTAMRPMETGDGLLMRIKPHSGVISIAGLLAIAEAARRFGSGEIDLTNRANLQIRGLSTDSYEGALELLLAAELIDESPDAEAVRNILVDPLSGLDETRALVRPLCARLEARFASNETLSTLPGKFGFSFSGCTSARVCGRASDIMVFAPGRDEFAIALDGDPASMAWIEDADVIETMERLAYVFLSLRANDPSIGRMRDAVARCGSVAMFKAGGLTRVENPRRDDRATEVLPGILHSGANVIAAAVGLPFGRIKALELVQLCTQASEAGVTSVYPTPNRIFVLPADATKTESLLKAARSLDLITETDDPRQAMDVCPGAPSCRNATTATRDDAQMLAQTIRDEGLDTPSIHISGCKKGCARWEAAELTFVGRDGAYDLIRDDGPLGPVLMSSIKPDRLADAARKLIAGRGT